MVRHQSEFCTELRGAGPISIPALRLSSLRAAPSRKLDRNRHLRVMRPPPRSLTLIQRQVTRMNFLIKVLTLVLLSLLILSSIAARGKDSALRDSNLTVSVYNDAVIPAATLYDAETIAARIFEESGIHVVWLNCSPGNPMTGAVCKMAVSERNLQVRVGRHSLNLQPSSSVFRISYLTAATRRMSSTNPSRVCVGMGLRSRQLFSATSCLTKSVTCCSEQIRIPHRESCVLAGIGNS